MVTNEIRCIAPTGDECGEGLVWSIREQCLYWTDINRYLIHRYDPATQSVRSWVFEEPVVALALTRDSDELLVALGSRLIWWNPHTDARRDHGFGLVDAPAVRLNDGRVGPNGELYIGSMKNNVDVAEDPRFDFATAGKLFRIGRSGSSILRESIGIANTVCWAPSQDLLYFGDSFANVIRVYDYDKRTGGIAGERDFFAQFERGVPDGSAMDQDGYLWNCRFGGACVVRIAPNGRIDRVIEMPVLNITTCTFGGPGLSTLFITTARVGGGTGNRLAGSLFAVDVGTPGLPDFLFDP